MEDTEVFATFLGALDQIKMFHWTTMSYARHKALDELHSTLSEKTDKFIECWMGRMKKQPVKKLVVKIPDLHGDSSVKPDGFLEDLRLKISDISNGTLTRTPELQNILEDYMADIDQCLYLIKLN